MYPQTRDTPRELPSHASTTGSDTSLSSDEEEYIPAPPAASLTEKAQFINGEAVAAPPAQSSAPVPAAPVHEEQVARVMIKACRFTPQLHIALRNAPRQLSEDGYDDNQSLSSFASMSHGENIHGKASMDPGRRTGFSALSLDGWLDEMHIILLHHRVISGNAPPPPPAPKRSQAFAPCGKPSRNSVALFLSLAQIGEQFVPSKQMLHTQAQTRRINPVCLQVTAGWFCLLCSNATTTILQLIEVEPSLLQLKDGFGCNALHVACASGSDQLVALLLKRGMPIHGTDKHGRHPLLHCIIGAALSDFFQDTSSIRMSGLRRLSEVLSQDEATMDIPLYSPVNDSLEERQKRQAYGFSSCYEVISRTILQFAFEAEQSHSSAYARELSSSSEAILGHQGSMIDTQTDSFGLCAWHYAAVADRNANKGILSALSTFGVGWKVLNLHPGRNAGWQRAAPFMVSEACQGTQGLQFLLQMQPSDPPPLLDKTGEHVPLSDLQAAEFDALKQSNEPGQSHVIKEHVQGSYSRSEIERAERHKDDFNPADTHATTGASFLFRGKQGASLLSEAEWRLWLQGEGAQKESEAMQDLNAAAAFAMTSNKNLVSPGVDDTNVGNSSSFVGQLGSHSNNYRKHQPHESAPESAFQVQNGINNPMRPSGGSADHDRKNWSNFLRGNSLDSSGIPGTLATVGPSPGMKLRRQISDDSSEAESIANAIETPDSPIWGSLRAEHVDSYSLASNQLKQLATDRTHLRNMASGISMEKEPLSTAPLSKSRRSKISQPFLMAERRPGPFATRWTSRVLQSADHQSVGKEDIVSHTSNITSNASHHSHVLANSRKIVSLIEYFDLNSSPAPCSPAFSRAVALSFASLGRDLSELINGFDDISALSAFEVSMLDAHCPVQQEMLLSLTQTPERHEDAATTSSPVGSDEGEAQAMYNFVLQSGLISEHAGRGQRFGAAKDGDFLAQSARSGSKPSPNKIAKNGKDIDIAVGNLAERKIRKMSNVGIQNVQGGVDYLRELRQSQPSLSLQPSVRRNSTAVASKAGGLEITSVDDHGKRASLPSVQKFKLAAAGVRSVLKPPISRPKPMFAD